MGADPPAGDPSPRRRPRQPLAVRPLHLPGPGRAGGRHPRGVDAAHGGRRVVTERARARDHRARHAASGRPRSPRRWPPRSTRSRTGGSSSASALAGTSPSTPPSAYPFDHRAGRFEETLAIIVPARPAASASPCTGRWHHVDDAVLIPPPRDRRLPGRIPLLIAAKGERVLRLTAHRADAWNTAWLGVPDERFAPRRADLVAACEAEGRAPRPSRSRGLTLGARARRPHGGRGARRPTRTRSPARSTRGATSASATVQVYPAAGRGADDRHRARGAREAPGGCPRRGRAAEA